MAAIPAAQLRRLCACHEGGTLGEKERGNVSALCRTRQDTSGRATRGESGIACMASYFFSARRSGDEQLALVLTALLASCVYVVSYVCEAPERQFQLHVWAAQADPTPLWPDQLAQLGPMEGGCV